MNTRELQRQHGQLLALISRTSTACASDLELQAHWAKHMCVLSAGLVENAVELIYGEFATKKSSQPVANYARSVLSRIQNPKTERFIELSRSFKAEWGNDLEAFVNDDGRKEAIDSIMANRHLIVHGRSSGISMARVKDYLAKAVTVLEFIELQLGV
jgi:hypothetical protein